MSEVERKDLMEAINDIKLDLVSIRSDLKHHYKLAELQSKLIDSHQRALVGSNGDTGVIGHVQEIKGWRDRFINEQNKRFWVIMGALTTVMVAQVAMNIFGAI